MRSSVRLGWVISLACVSGVLAFAACVGEDPDVTSAPGSNGDASAIDAAGGNGDATTAPPSWDGGPSNEAAPGEGPAVRCGSNQLCQLPSETCCSDGDASAACSSLAACAAGSSIACDSRDDCPAGQLCCGSVVADSRWRSACAVPNGDGKCAERAFCRSLADCPDGDVSCDVDETYAPLGMSVCTGP